MVPIMTYLLREIRLDTKVVYFCGGTGFREDDEVKVVIISSPIAMQSKLSAMLKAGQG